MDPYRIFFPMGLFFGVLGALLWVMFGFGLLTSYPGQIHADFMMGGFLFSFASGFLMTAVPRFTGASSASKGELILNFALIVSLLAWGLLGLPALFYGISFASMVFLVVFSAKRFASRSYDPPRYFIFVGMGLLCGTTGSLLLALAAAGLANPGASALGRVLYYHGMILSFVIGVGNQLLPALFGHQDFSRVRLTHFRGGTERPSLASRSGLALLSLALIASFLIEAFWDARAGRTLRALVVSAVAFGSWRLHKRPVIRGNLPFWLWLSAWSLLSGSWAPVLVPALAIHGMHLAFIGGFGIMTLMIASRVALAHGGYGMELERNSRAIAAAGILILFAALTRLSAGALPKTYLHHLAYAAATWIVGLGVWALVFVPRMVFKGGLKDEAGHC